VFSELGGIADDCAKLFASSIACNLSLRLRYLSRQRRLAARHRKLMTRAVQIIEAAQPEHHV